AERLALLEPREDDERILGAPPDDLPGILVALIDRADQDQLPAGHRRLLERLNQVELALDPIQPRDAHHITARGESERLENFRRSDSRKTRYAVRDEARPHAVLVMNGVAQDLRDD